VKDIETMMESSANIEVAEMEKNTGYLGIIASIAPMVGFIGTISGVIRIFYNISLSDNISIGVISGGLYEKMITSGAGLIVGVLAYSGYHYLHLKIQRFTLQVQKDAYEFMRSILSPAS
jgi:biopolymer transport protein ExbB